jgi:hypothetical protein
MGTIDAVASNLQAGDKVVAHGNHGEYEVRTVDIHQGRVQVTDTAGEIHTYHREDSLSVTRTG